MSREKFSKTSLVGDFIRVEMFGGLTIRVGDRMLSPIAGRKAVSLLAYIVCRRDRPHTRDVLVGRFWPELDNASARKRLSHAMWQIGAAFTDAEFESILVRTKETVSLRSDIVIALDIELFDNRLDDFEDLLLGQDEIPADVTELAEVVNEYQVFLEGYYGDWIEHERVRLAARRLDALSMLVRIFKRRGEYDVALRYGRQLVAADPLREESHREVMRICGLAGHVSGAKNQYQLCCEALKKELGLEPSIETTELVRRVEREVSVGGVPDAVTSAEPLFGRAQMLSDLWTRVEGLIDGQGGLMLLEGELGMGKSRVVAELAEGARWRGAEVISASHNDRNRWIPYGALCEAIGPSCTGFKGDHVAELLDPLWVSLVRKFIPTFGEGMDAPPVSKPTILRGDEEVWRSAEALARVVLALGKVRPTVLVLEDLQWADQEMLRTLRLLSKDLADSGVLLCLTYRRSEAQQVESIWDGLSELSRVDHATKFDLAPLSDDNMHRLLASQPGGNQLSEDASARLLDVVSGNPLFAIQVLGHPEFLNTQPSNEPTIEDVAVDVMAEVVGQRLASASDEVRQVLDLLAVLGEPSDSKALARLLGAPRTSIKAAMSEAVHARFLGETIDGCEFVNKEIRRLVYESLPEQRRVDLHNQVLDYWLAVGGEPNQILGDHAWRAHRWEDAQRHHLRAALADADLNAFKTASTHFAYVDQSAAKLGLSLIDWFDDALAYEEALNTVSWRDKQEELLDRLLVSDLNEEQRILVELRQVRFMALTFSGEKTTDAAKQVVGRAEDSGLLLDEALASAGVSLFLAGNSVVASEFLSRARDLLDPGSDRWAEVSLSYFSTSIDLESNDSIRAAIERVTDSYKYDQNLQFQADVMKFEAMAYLHEGRPEQATEVWKKSIQIAQKIGYFRTETLGWVNLGASYGFMARAGEALQAYEKGATLLPLLGDERGLAFVDMGRAEIFHRIIGDDKKARTLLNQAAALFRSMDDIGNECCCLENVARIDLRAGRTVRARKLLTHLLTRFSEQPWLWAKVQCLASLSTALLAAGEHQEAIETANQAVSIIGELGNNGFLPGVLATKALALLELAEVDEAKEVANEAVKINSESSFYPHLEAWRLAQVFRRSGEAEQANEQIVFAHKMMEQSLAGLSPELHKQAMRGVAEHVAIRDAFGQMGPIVTHCRWPRHPKDETISDTGYIELDLTVSLPEDWGVSTEAERRRHRLRRIWKEAEAQGVTPSTRNVAILLDVSDKTIRRDLVQLDLEPSW